MLEEREKLSLTNIVGGAAIERFNLALQEIFDNIMDVNTDADAKREIVLKVAMKPNKDRDMIVYGLQVITKPAPLSAVTSHAVMGRGINGEGEAYEVIPHQQKELPVNVKPIKWRENNA